MTGGSSTDARGRGALRGPGQAEVRASRTSRRCTRYLRANSRTDGATRRWPGGRRRVCRPNTRSAGWPAVTGSLSGAVMVGWPGALEDRLPSDALVARAGGAAVARRPREKRRAFGASARERSAAPEHRPGPVRARRPGPVRCAGPVHPAAAVGRNLPSDIRDTAGLAPQTGRAEARHEHTAQARTAADGPEHRPYRRPPCEGELTMGLPADPWLAD